MSVSDLAPARETGPRAPVRHLGEKAGRVGGAALALTFAMAPFALAGPAQAAGDVRVTQYDIDYVVGKDGGVDVTERLQMDFPDSSHHGFDRYLTLATKYPSVKDKHRVYPLSEVSVTSPSGAPTHLSRESNGVQEHLRVGDKDRTVSGQQTYVLKYHLDAVVNKQANGTTEFHWNALGGSWKLPIDKVAVTVKGPANVTSARCFTGRYHSTESCEATPGETARFSAENTGDGSDVTVVTAMATSAFTSTDPRLAEGSTPEAPGAGGPLSQSQREVADYAGMGLAVAVPAAVGGAMVRHRRRYGQDDHFVGLAPGAVPASGQDARVVPGPETKDVAVRFEPPTDTTPGLMGTILDRSADDRDVSGTVVDLAVRGYLTMQDLGDNDWQLTAQQAPAGDVLLPYEAGLLNALFADGDTVRLSDLKNHFAEHHQAVKDGLMRETVERGWFKESPVQARGRMYGFAMVLGVMAVIAFFVANMLNLNGFIFGAGFGLAAVMVAAMGSKAGARTATGSAIYDQSRGFEKYLRTAEAKQIKFEEAESIFSRYMPYAVVLGVADRWAKVFAEVANAAQAQGYSIGMPYWYLPYGGYGGFGGFEGLGSSLDGFGSDAASAFTSTPGGSGGSGFSGGGGFSGSGGGGGGGGAW